MSGRSPPLYCTLTLIVMQGHQKNIKNNTILYYTCVDSLKEGDQFYSCVRVIFLFRVWYFRVSIMFFLSCTLFMSHFVSLASSSCFIKMHSMAIYPDTQRPRNEGPVILLLSFYAPKCPPPPLPTEKCLSSERLSSIYPIRDYPRLACYYLVVFVVF